MTSTPHDATVVFDENLVGIWFVESTPTQDLLVGLSRDGEGGFVIRYRFKYHSEDSTDPFDGKDRRSSYTAKAPDRPLSQVLDEVQQFIEHSALSSQVLFGHVAKVHGFVRRDGESLDEFLERFRAHADFAHFREVPDNK